MTYVTKMRRVVLPQAMRVIIPPTGNEFIAMMKDTALISFLGGAVATSEMFRRSQLVGKADFKNLEAYVLVAAMYWALTVLFSLLQQRLEAELQKAMAAPAVKERLAAMGAMPGVQTAAEFTRVIQEEIRRWAPKPGAAVAVPSIAAAAARP